MTDKSEERKFCTAAHVSWSEKRGCFVFVRCNGVHREKDMIEVATPRGSRLAYLTKGGKEPARSMGRVVVF